jgi:predicted Zn-dependent protease
VREYPDTCNYAYRLAGVQERIDDLDGALESLDHVIERCPDHRDAVVSAAKMAASLERIDQAARYLRRWLDRYPTDQTIRDALSRLQGQTTPQ